MCSLTETGTPWRSPSRPPAVTAPFGRCAARHALLTVERAVTAGGRLGLLHGVPVSVKEHIAVAGLPVLVLGIGEKRARFDDLGVARLRDPGAVIVATTP